MRKITGLLLFVVCIGFVLGACSKGESYSDRVKKERKLINNFIAERDIVVLDSYPANGVFKSNEYYRDASGVYINVVDSGNGTRANKGAQVFFRFIGASSLPYVDSVAVNLSEISPLPLQFTYGVTSTYVGLSSTDIPNYRYLSPGITDPLKYVGEGAVVRLIVPFKGDVGSSYQSLTYSTLYYDQVTYSTIIN